MSQNPDDEKGEWHDTYLYKGKRFVRRKPDLLETFGFIHCDHYNIIQIKTKDSERFECVDCGVSLPIKLTKEYRSKKWRPKPFTPTPPKEV